MLALTSRSSLHRFAGVFRCAVLVGALTLGLPTTHAQSTWSGGGADGNWGTSGNWSTTINNNFNTALVFAGTTKTSNTNTLTGGTATSITFNAGAGAFTLSGNALTLGGNVANNSSNLQTIQNNITIKSNNTFSGAALTFTGALANTYGSRLTTLTSTGGVIASGPIYLASVSGSVGNWTFNGTSDFTVNGSIANNSSTGAASGFYWASSGVLTLNGTNTFTNYLSGYGGGVISVPSFANALSTVSALRLGGTTSSGTSPTVTLRYTGTGETFSKGISIGNASTDTVSSTVTIEQAGSGLLQLNTATMLTGSSGVNSTLILQGSTSGTGEFTGNVNTGASSTLNVTKRGSGTWILSSAGNSYNGQLTIEQGTLQTGTTINNAGANGVLGNSANAVVMGTNGTMGTFAYTGASSQSTNKRFTLASGGTGGFSVVTATTSLTLSGSIDGSGGLYKAGAGNLVLSGSNSFTGATTVSAGSLSFSGAAALGSTSGVSIANGAGLAYTGTTAATFDRNITVSGAPGSIGTVTNSGSALTLSGTLTKNGTILQLAGGSFTVTGPIVGASANSDLYVNGASVTLSSTGNSYVGPTVVFGGGLLTLGDNNVIPSNSFLTLGNGTSAGTFLTNGRTNAIGGLAFGSAGGTLKLAATSTSAAPLTAATGTMTLTNGTLDLAGSGTSAGLYHLLSAQSISGSFATISNPSAGYQVVTTGSTVDYQQQAVLGTLTVNNPASAIITGGTAAFTYSVQNAAFAGGDALSVAGSGNANVVGSSSGSVLAGTTGTLSGLSFTSTTVGSAQAGTFTVNSSNAYGTTSTTGTVTVDVLAHSSASLDALTLLTSTTISLGTYDPVSGWSGGTGSSLFSLANLASTSPASLTAALDVTGTSATGDAGFATTLNLAAYSLIAGGSSASYTVSFNPAGYDPGNYSATFTFNTADQKLPGWASGNTLTLTANVVVVPEPGALALAGIGVGFAAWLARRRNR